METRIDIIKRSLEVYTNRQAVLNYYEGEDELVQRDGLDFQIIEVTDEKINFISDEKVKASIDLYQYQTFKQSTDFFKNYFELINGLNVLRIYFP